MISENDSSSEDEVPLEVSNETAKRQTLESVRLQSGGAEKSKKKRRQRKKLETLAAVSNGDESDASDEPSDAISSKDSKSVTDKRSAPGQRANGGASDERLVDELMTDDESSDSNMSEMEDRDDSNVNVSRRGNHIDDAHSEAVGTNENVATFESETNQPENKGKSNQCKGLSLRKNLPVQWKNGTNISSVNENSSSSIESLSGSTSHSRGKKKFTIRRADKANKVANRLLYRKPGAALALNFKERMLYSTTRIARINASTLLANRERRSHL